jgi:flagellar hook-associated protein 1 FlgK
MSIMGLFDIGRSGIFANQLALRVVSNNIANINTPGYSRQDAIMQIASPVDVSGHTIGRGVGDVDVRRHMDNFTFLQIIGQSTNYGRSSSLQSGLSNVEQIFNETQGFGLMNTMEEYFNAWQEVATNPDGAAQRSTLLVKGEAFVNTARQIESDIKNTLKFINDEIGDVVKQVNVLTENIAEINGKVQEVEAGGVEVANVFRDQRELMMKELSQLINYDFNEDKDGTVTIVAGRRSIVAGIESYTLSSSVNLEGNRDIYNGSLNITPFINSGELGGYIAVRDDIENNSLNNLRTLVASVTQETNWLHNSRPAATTFDLDNNGGTNFFNTLTNSVYTRDDTTGGSSVLLTTSIPDESPGVFDSLEEYDIVFTDPTTYEVHNHATGSALVPPVTGVYNPAGTTVTINGVQVDMSGVAAANDTFFVSPIRNAIRDFGVALTSGRQVAAARTGAAVGDNTNALAMVEMYGRSVNNLGSDTFHDYYGEIVSTAGSMSQSATDSLKFDDNLLFELNNRREATSGVSLDEEAASLIRYQRAFEAGARIIRITDELLEQIINL